MVVDIRIIFKLVIYFSGVGSCGVFVFIEWWFE